MRKTIYRVLPLALTLAAVGCSEDDLTSGDGKIHAGEEVQFGVALSSETRTIYGNETSTGFPIYWVDGDLVRVASPQCNVKTAEYMVTTKDTLHNYNYAESLTKTGETGIQWGTAETADFYSIYPSSENTSLTVNGESVSTQLYVASTQRALLTDTTDASGNAYYYAEPADMNNVVMYAQTLNQANGSTVDLQYIPFSTVLEFTLTAPTSGGAGDASTTVYTITLTAPEGTNIAGNFDFTFPETAGGDPSITAVSDDNASNSITMHIVDASGAYAVLTPSKNTLKAKMCLMPIANVSSLEDWTIKVSTSGGDYSRKLTATDISGATTSSGSTETTTALTPGKVHKITMPALNYGTWNYDPASWMTELPDYTNIYLTELSLPGAWYAGESEYQSTTSISDFWDAGIRAFAVECRSGYSSYLGWLTGDQNRVFVSGTGRNYSTLLYGDCYYNGTRLSTIISSVANAINTEEYAVLVLSYADGGEGGHETSDYAYFLEGIAAEITASGATNIYSQEITPSTTIGDVLGKLIIKVNVDKNIADNNSYDVSSMNALFSYAPFYSQIKETMGTAFNASDVYTTNMYWNSWSNSESYTAFLGQENLDPDQLAMTFSTANRTQTEDNGDDDLPTYSNRQAQLTAMMDKSHLIYEDGDHSMWYYFNCGGTQTTSSTSSSTSPTNFASTMNDWLLKLINNKTYASPLGLVFYNYCTNSTYYGPDITDAIIQMNNKFYLMHKGE